MFVTLFRSGPFRTIRTLLSGCLCVVLAGATGLVSLVPAVAAGPSGTPFNPTAGTQGFTVFVAGNAQLNSQASGGPVALGGSLVFGGTNLAEGRSIVASSQVSSARPASDADDGYADTYWESAASAFPATLTVDLGATRSVGRVVLRMPSSFTARTETLSVLTSTNGSTFTTLVASTGYTFNPTTGNTATITFAPTSARYVRLSVTANSGTPAAQIGEFEVYAPGTGSTGTFTVASQTAGSFTAPGDARPTGLLVGGRINWGPVAPSAVLSVGSNAYVKVGDLTGTTIAQSGTAPTHLVSAGQGYTSLPQVAEQTFQPTSSVNQSGLIDFTDTFRTLRSRSIDIGQCNNTVVLTSSNGTPLPNPIPAGTDAFFTVAGSQNILDITAANLANIRTLTARSSLSANAPLVVNVDTTGVGDAFTWLPPTVHGVGTAGSAYVLWNFPTTTRLTIGSQDTVLGTVYAPRAAIYEYSTDGIQGGVIAATYSQGGPNGTTPGGQVMSAPFAATVQSCSTARLTIAKSADVASTTVGSTVHYTVTATNTGGSAYTGASFTDPLTGVLDDATYDGNAAASTGMVSYSAPTLSWTGDLAVGASATITYSVTVKDPDPGDHRLTNTVSSTTAGNNCPSAGGDPACRATVTVSGLVITKTADTASVAHGGIVHYTVTVTNNGQTPYTGASFADPLTGVLDDATYDGNATATLGTVTFTNPTLTWTGDLPVGGSATVTYSVTVANPDTGNRSLTNTVTSTTQGNNCPSGSLDPRCTVAVTVSLLSISKSADTASVVAGGIVHYTVTVTNNGQTPYTGASFADPLTGVLDDGSYNHDATATAGAVSFVSPTLTWTGDLAPGAAVTVTYSVTANDPDTGDHSLTNTVTSTAVGATCPIGTTSPACTVTIPVLVPALTIAKTADTATTTPGGTVHYTVTVTNTGQAPYTGAAFADSLAGVLDDATYNSDAAATVGTVSYAAPTLSWSGNLAVGASATVTYSVTVFDPNPGNDSLLNVVTSTTSGNNCPVDSADTRCSARVQVLVPGLTITKAADASTAVPGGTVHYTVTVTNSGQTPYTGAAFSDSLAGVVDDATYGNDAAASAGTVSYSAPALSWSGNLAVGASVTVTYSVTVHNPDTGNHLLANAVTSTTVNSNCPGGGMDPRCALSVPVSELTIAYGSDVSAARPGGTVRLTATFTNSGQTPFTGITVSTDASDAFDDVIPNGDQTATSGVLSVGPTTVTWTGDISVGDTVTLTGTLTVKNPDPGNKRMTGTLVTVAPGSNCPAGGSDPRCSVDVAVVVPGLTVVKSADTAVTVPGATVGYTVTVTNSGETAYTGAVVTDSLSGVLGDSVYNGDATATAGAVSYTSPTLTWTGDLAVGGSVTVTYSVTVNDPDTGGKVLANSAVSTEEGSNCPPASPAPACSVTVAVLTPALTIAKSADVETATPGTTVHYTVTVTNSGQIAYTGAAFADSLVGVLDDAAYNTDAAATSGAVSFSSPVLSWSGDLAVGASAAVTYSVTVDNPDTGNHNLTNTITSTTTGNNCPTGSTDPRCTTTTAVSTLTIVNIANVTATSPGQVVRYTVTATNTGQTPYLGVSIVTNMTGTVDDASYNGDTTASSGSLVFGVPQLGMFTWTGDLAPGALVTITGSWTVRNPDTGNHVLTTAVTSAAPGNNCPAGGTDPRCGTSVRVLQPALTVTKAADTVTTTPGATVHYTITATNTGETAYTGAALADSLAGLLSDASYDGNAASTSGTVSYDAPTLTWTGDLAVGASVTVTYSITVNDPDTGDKFMVNNVTSAEIGSNCSTGGSDPRCTATVTVLVPELGIVKTADVTTAVPGTTVHYTVTVTNSGQAPYVGTSLTDSLTGVLDDATYNADATATAGTVTYTSPTLTWTGDLATGAVVTITYSATVTDPAAGDRTLSNTVVSAAAGNNCATGGTDPACTATVAVLIPELTITKTADTNTVVQGGIVHYTIVLTNTGQSAYTGATVTDSLAQVLQDSRYPNDAVATSGTVAYDAPNLTWTGDLEVGATVVVTYSVTTEDVDIVNPTMENTVTSTTRGNNCPPAGTDPRCSVTVAAEPVSITLTDLTGGFTMTGGVDSLVQRDGAVTMTVTTNSPNGYAVTVQAASAEAAPTMQANPDAIPISALAVRETGRTTFQPLSDTAPVLVHAQAGPSAQGGDVLSNDYQLAIPNVVADQYTATLNYVAATE